MEEKHELVDKGSENKEKQNMEELIVILIHVVLASFLALGPLAFALYFDLKQKSEVNQDSR